MNDTIVQLARTLATLSAGIWLGGIILMAIVAPTTFGVMRETGVDHPNYLAGRVMAKNFTRFDKVQMVCATILIVGQITCLLAGRPQWRDWGRLALTIAAACLLAYSAYVMTPKILNLQSAVSGVDDPEAAVRKIFDGFHKTAVLIAQVNLVLVLIIAVEMAWPQRGVTKVERISTVGGTSTS